MRPMAIRNYYFGFGNCPWQAAEKTPVSYQAIALEIVILSEAKDLRILFALATRLK